MTKRIKMHIEMEVTVAQALALNTMFEYWNTLSSVGRSRRVAFFVDGDGNFHPQCQITCNPRLPFIERQVVKKLAIAADDNGNRVYDFDELSSLISSPEFKLHQLLY